MSDKSLDIFLMVLFGMGGITLLILAWAQPMPLMERILIISAGLIGIFWVLIRLLGLRSLPAKTGMDKIPPEVEVKGRRV